MVLTDNYIDGEEFVGLLPAEVREMVPPIGLAKKIIKLIPTSTVYMYVRNNWINFSAIGAFFIVQQTVEDRDPGLAGVSLSTSPAVRLPSLSLGPSSPISPGSLASVSTTPSRSMNKIQLPEFWRDETQEALDEGILNEAVCGDIVRTLVTLPTAKYGPKPGRARCEDLARQLILEYPFAKDDLGSGYVSGILSHL